MGFLITAAQYRNFRSPFPVEIDGISERVLPESFLDTGIQSLEYDIVFLELDLGLGGAYVHIHSMGIDIQIDEIHRRSPL